MAEARYDAVADFYVSNFSEADAVLLTLIDMAGPVAGRAVLDLACGHGRAARELAARGAEVLGVDLSGELLERAAPGIRYVQGDAARPEWLGDERFDVVVCSFALSDIDDLDGALRTVKMALRPGGVFVFSLLHPCFPGGAGVAGAWPEDSSYYEQGWWRTGSESATLRRQVGANHRMLSTYVNALARHGLAITEMREPEPDAEWAVTRPSVARHPVYLVVRCQA
jgi:ubiquinone/menaquinone biosynthesis C-methylase UbiE